MTIVGREKEKAALKQYYESETPEFLAVYGRRRIGKTFLIREFFGGKFDFYATGLANGKKEDQLLAWDVAIKDSFGGPDTKAINGIYTKAESGADKKNNIDAIKKTNYSAGKKIENWLDAFILLKINLKS